MSQAVVHDGVVHLAGQVSEGRPGTTISDQVRETLGKIDDLLLQTGSGPDRILSATVWLRRARDYDEMNAAWIEWLDPRHRPARATICGVELAAAVYDVEIMVVAALTA